MLSKVYDYDKGKMKAQTNFVNLQKLSASFWIVVVTFKALSGVNSWPTTTYGNLDSFHRMESESNISRATF